MAKSYNHRKIEEKWNKFWSEKRTTTDLNSAKEKFYCLDMFPYPSGDGLHVGHWRGYVMSDFYSRHALLNGKNVLHPMGFDSFGLPAENAAIKHKSHPKKFIDSAIINFKEQLKSMGAVFDWDKEITTSSPEYYKWTQWLFLQLYKKGYAERRKGLVNWCPKDQTVLANEQVVNGCCERCGTTVTKKELFQWYFLTTKLADELLKGLDDVEWPERVKHLQKNWIGRSEGATIAFATGKSETIQVFTTRPDTIFGVTALVLAPEHPLTKDLAKQGGKEKEFEAYFKEVSAKTNIDRQQSKESEKTAVYLGVDAEHPLTGEKIPVWVADYVLMEYGTGAVMSVPAHDERDFMFAKTHKLEVKKVIEGGDLPYVGDGKLVESGEFDGQNSDEAAKNIVKKLGEIGLGKATENFRLRDWLVSRQRYWGAPIPIVYDPEGKEHPVKEEHLPILLPEDVDFIPGGESPITRSNDYIKLAEKLYGKGWRFETDTLDTFVDSSWYFMRFLSPTNDKKAIDTKLVEKWMPVDLYIGGIEHATMHLLYARFIYRFMVKEGYVNSSNSEPFKRLFNIGMITLHGSKMSKSKGNVVSPDPLVEHYGTDALRGYEMFVGPLELDAEWSSRGINGIHRFLIKLFNFTDNLSESSKPDGLFNTYLNNANEMIKDYKLNTLIAEYMKFLNTIEKTGCNKEVFERFLITLSPTFPYISQELWAKIGNKGNIFDENWPAYKEIKAKLMIKVLINQRFITNIEDPGSEDAVIKALGSKITGKVVKTIYVPGKVANIVVK